MTETKEMTFLQHLVDLRKRVIHSLWGVLICFGIAYHFAEQIFGWMLKPLCNAFGSQDSCPIVFTGLAEPFMVYLKVGLVAGIFLASPWIFFQVWNFISPGLKSEEKKYVIPFVFVATVMFVGGALLGYLYIFPMAFPFFLSQAMAPIRPMLSMQDYFSFASGLLFAFGALFEIPVFVILINFIGLVHSKTLWKTWRFAVAGIFVLAAVLTPADPYTMLIVGLPLAVLFLVALGLCSLHDKVRGRVLKP